MLGMSIIFYKEEEILIVVAHYAVTLLIVPGILCQFRQKRSITTDSY